MSINFNKKKVLVIGLGETGQSALHFLANKECDIQAIDTRPTIDNFETIKEKFKDVEGIEKDILSMIQFALDKAWIEKAN